MIPTLPGTTPPVGVRWRETQNRAGRTQAQLHPALQLIRSAELRKPAVREELGGLIGELTKHRQPISATIAPASSALGSNVWAGHMQDKKKKSGLSGKEAANDVPSWATGERPLPSENGRDFAERLLNGKYGAGNYPTGPGSEFNKIKKWGDRAFE